MIGIYLLISEADKSRFSCIFSNVWLVATNLR